MNSQAKEMLANGTIVLSSAVRNALTHHKPIVALESTIISHGMPYPQNLATALEVEEVAIKNGVVPATIAVLEGKIHIGLEQHELKTLALLGHKCIKCSRRDLAYVVANRLNGATTVAATMYCASLVNIKVFVTGGIGGVHRGVETSMDVSADLTELGRTNVAVICAGVKSILDIRKTLEYLETEGVPVVAYKQKMFPAFFTPDSGFQAPISVQSANEFASMIAASSALGLKGGMVLGVPVPAHQAAQLQVVEDATVRALREADEKHINGKNITPFLLQRINELTQGKSLTANIALIKNNCQVGSEIAKSLAQATRRPTVQWGAPMVVGATNLDLLGRPSGALLQRTSNMGVIDRSFGGVGRNIAEVLGRLGTRPFFVTAVGNDVNGHAMVKHCETIGVQTSGILQTNQYPTNTYMGIFDENGDLVTTINEMTACDYLTPHRVSGMIDDHVAASKSQRIPIAVLDGNLSPETLASTLKQCTALNIPTFFEPTSFVKSIRVVNAFSHVTFASPNEEELLCMYTALRADRPEDVDLKTLIEQEEHDYTTPSIRRMCDYMLSKMAAESHLIVTRGKLGCCVASRSASSDGCSFTVLPVVPAREQVNSSGAGDTLVGGTVYGLCELLEKSDGQWTLGSVPHQMVVQATAMGMAAATLTVESARSVSTKLSPAQVQSRVAIQSRL